ncbi:MAG: TolC family protein, partial [Proteobacteria bacterium]|nr:TolC family protein [Pseudomonadota bacterium]
MTRHCSLILWVVFLCLALLLAGCGVSLTSGYQTPAVTVPAGWKHGPEVVDGRLHDRWWQRFGDHTLNQLIVEVLATNNDLAAAGIVARRAWLRTDLAHSALSPSLSAKGSSGISRGLGNSEQGETRTFSFSAAVGYELDLWGKLGYHYDAASRQAQASEEDLAATALSLIGTTASAYLL